MHSLLRCLNRYNFITKFTKDCEIGCTKIIFKYSQRKNFSLDSQLNAMRFVQYNHINGGPQRLGAQLSPESDVVDISFVDCSLPNNLVDLLNEGEEFINKARKIVCESRSIISKDKIEFLSPITHPDKVICIGLNYRGHCEEQNKPLPQEPCIFNKFPSVIVGPYSDVVHPSKTKALDWEVELAVVIGKKGKNIPKENAMDYVFGYTIGQDISARDWQKSKNNGQWLLGKSMDTFCPLGPAVVMKEHIPDPHSLNIKCSINGVMKQNANTEELIFKVDDIISYVSQFFTILPGDVILTGTPSGVGVFREPREFLKPGDVIESEISQIGKIINKVV